MANIKTKLKNVFLRQAPRLPDSFIRNTAAVLQRFPSVSAETHSQLGDILLSRGASRPAGDAYWAALIKDPKKGRFSWRLRMDGVREPSRTPQRMCELREIVAQYPNARMPARTLSTWLVDSGDVMEAELVNRSLARRISTDQGGTREQLLPSFLIIGMDKSGTTSLYNYLSQHGQVVPAIQKEINYWSQKFELGWDWYQSHFPFADPAYITGEASPSTIIDAAAPHRIYKKLPHAKLILLLRNPVDQAFSRYNMWAKTGFARAPWSELIRRELALAPECPLSLDLVASQYDTLLLRNICLPFLQHWQAIFPQDQMMILQSEDLFRDPDTSVNKVFQFLGLPADHRQDYRNHNPGEYDALPWSDRKVLQEYYEPYRRALEDYLALPLGWW